MTSSYVNQPKCADGCIPFEYCEPQVSTKTGKPYRKCHKCNNFVNDPATQKTWENKPKCSESGGVCSAWADSASTEFTSKAGNVLRRCLVCANLINDPSIKKTSGFKRTYPQPGPLPAIPEDPHAETIAVLKLELDNVNSRLGKLEARIETILEQLQKNC